MVASRVPRSVLVVLLLCASSLLAPLASAWTPPPAEFPDVSPGSGIDFPVMKWEPSLGEAQSLRDVLPAGGAAAADYNRDGFPDLFVPNPGYVSEDLNEARQPLSRLYMNDWSKNTGGPEDIEGLVGGDERFFDITGLAGIDVRGGAYSASWGDVDDDGWPDLFVGGVGMARLFLNDRDGTFTEITSASGLPQDGLVLGGSWGDVDNDGLLDLYLVRFTGDDPELQAPDLHQATGYANALMRNRGDGSFEDVTPAAMAATARRSTSATIVDMNGDGFMDIYVTNYGEGAELWRGRSDGDFRERAANVGIGDGADATCQAWEDIDRDGDLDLFVAHEAGERDGLWLGNGAGVFTSAADALELPTRGSGWGCAVFDFDNDADMDIFVGHGAADGAMREQDMLLMNRLDEGVFAFVDATEEAGDRDIERFALLDTLSNVLATSGVAAVDWNLDGNDDLVTTTNDGDRLRLFRNMGWAVWSGSGNYVKVNLEGVTSNAHGLGAVVTVSAGNIEVTRQVGSAASWGGQSLLSPQFTFSRDEDGSLGYKNVARPVSVTIAWPSGQVDSYPLEFKVKSAITFVEGQGYRTDTLAPRPSILTTSGEAGANGWYTSEDVSLKLRAYDRFIGGSTATGVSSLRYSLDGSNWVTIARASTGVVLDFSGDGVHPLFVEVQDPAGNQATMLFPVRIDTTAPTGRVVSPAPGDVQVLGENVANVGPLALGRAILITPADVEGPDGPADGMGGDGGQAIVATAEDAGSGVQGLTFQLLRTNGRVVGESPVLRLAPYTWNWPSQTVAAGEYRLVTTVEDAAGHTSAYANKVIVVPAAPGGIIATALEGVSTPTP